MILLDAYAVVALLGGEPAAGEVRDLIREETTGLLAVNLAETAFRLSRGYGIAEERTRAAIESLVAGSGLQLLPVTPTAGWRAARIRAKHYHRSECPVSLADCVLLASAGGEDQIATSDPALLRIAAAEQTGRIALPNSDGTRFAPS